MSSLSTFSKSPMRVALEYARQGAAAGEVPVGAVIVHQGYIIAAAANHVIGHQDPTAHAEMIVLRQAGALLNTVHLTECDLYVTLEPCAMCAQALAWARIRRLIFGAYDPKSGAVDHGVRVFQHPSCQPLSGMDGGRG